MSEKEWIEWLTARAPRGDDVRIGIGDDAAIVDLTDSAIVACADMLLDGVHFRADQDAPEAIGHKALAVNLSDMAAMGARPLAAMVSVAFPQDSNTLDPVRLYDGILALAERFGVSLIGGDTTSWRGPLVLDISVLGRVGEQVWRRCDAQPGDSIGVTGQLGGSILGRHLDFTPRLDDANFLAARFDLHAAIDISDGLAVDLWRVVEASGCRASLIASQIPVSSAAHQLSAQDGRSALDHALSDGEDFELLITAPTEVMNQITQDPHLPTPITVIGKIEKGQGVELVDADGRCRPLERVGFEHKWGGKRD